jgi:hypothetical protein
MSGLLASTRFRRRVVWLGVVVLIGAAVAFVGFHFTNTGHPLRQSFRPGKPQIVPKNPKPDPFTAAERRQVEAVTTRFIESAVYRQNVGESFALTTSGLRQGLTRAAWASGSIPIVPFPAAAVQTVRWRVDYSYAHEVGLKVAFYPKPASGVDRQVFDIGLQQKGPPGTSRWLVSYWAPSGGAQLAQADPRASPVPTESPKPALGAIWLVVPMGIIVGGLVGVVAFLVVRERIRHNRAMRLYRSSSSPS